MTRLLVVGNGRMTIGFDEGLIMRDLYYPHVGQPNHIVGRRNQLGVWADGSFTWVSEDGWQRVPGYAEDSLVTDSLASHQGLGLDLEMRGGVHHRENIWLQRVRLRNRLNHPREVRLFATFDFDLDETDVGDTALWDPSLRVIFHYKRKRCFLIGAAGPSGGISQYATGRKRFQGAEGTWRDAEDGRLEGHPISQGSVDSTIAVSVPLASGGRADVYIWTVCGDGFRSCTDVHRMILEEGPQQMLDEVERYWRSWAGGARHDLDILPREFQAAYRRSLLILRTQVDHGGAILASTDSDILAYNRDHYGYMWPRDGALVAAALDRAGYGAVTRRFYRFCRDVLGEGGYFWHKYNPDGTVGSSWHPLVGAAGPQLPIQEDETALVLWALGNYYRLSRSQEFVDSVYAGLVRPAADFLEAYRNRATGLPLDSYDLWEERRGVFTFTTAAVVAGLQAAAMLAGALGNAERAQRYEAAAAETRAAMLKHLWSPERRRFLRGLYTRSNGDVIEDATLESSLAGLHFLGVLPPDDVRLAATMAALEQGLWCRTPLGGVARYYDDFYFRVGKDPDVTPGNPWIICTLWLARWHIATAADEEGLERAYRLIRWALDTALPTGVLPEQVDPFTGGPVSVAPLTWSHATLVDTLLDLAEKLQFLGTPSTFGPLGIKYPSGP